MISLPAKGKVFLLVFLYGFSSFGQTKNSIQDFSYADNSIYLVKTIQDPVYIIDSIAQTNSIASHFAAIYSMFMKNIGIQMKDASSDMKSFITKFETSFDNYFLKACADYKDGYLSPASGWSCYFSNPDIQPWQLILIGVNVHINEDMWRSMVDNFSESEIRHYKKQFLKLQPALVKGYSVFFNIVMKQKSYLKFINSFTKGLAKIAGEGVLYKWRKRNVNLAILFYHNPGKFKKRWETIMRKKQKIDEIILRK